MELDQDEPPELVDVEQRDTPSEPPTSAASHLQNLSLSKVPLTIVTGEGSFSSRHDVELKSYKDTWELGRARWSIIFCKSAMERESL